MKTPVDDGGNTPEEIERQIAWLESVVEQRRWKPYYAALKAENPQAYQQCIAIVEAHKQRIQQRLRFNGISENGALTAMQFGDLERAIVVHTCELLNICPYNED